jgi:alpha-glucosidase
LPRPLALSLLLASLALSSCSSEEAAPASPAPPAAVDREAEAQRLLSGPDWYRHAVFYELYVRSFQDSDGDGIGDFKGLTSRLDYLKGLGVDALWLMPIMPTPFKDSGYDIADYRGINPDYGTMADFDEFLAEAKKRQIRVVVDLVLNHTSDQHAWFQESRASKDNPKADWYVWSDTPNPPDNPCKPQQPIFGDSPWQLDPARNQYYFHRFYAEQPDLNYRNPEVVEATLDVARFWMDKGVDGFRCDVIALLHESKDGCDLLPETKDYIRSLRKIVDGYPGAVLLAESTNFDDASAYFGNGSDMFHMAFNFAYGYIWGFDFTGGKSKRLYEVFEKVAANYPQGAQDALVIGSHDVIRSSVAVKKFPWSTRRAAEIQFFMRGTPYIYYGEELGLLPGQQTIVDLRDAARTPMPWEPGPGQGFTTGSPWIAFGPDSDALSVSAQQADPASTFAFYRGMLSLRRGHEVWGTGAVRLLPLDSDRVFAFARENDQEAYLIAINLTEDPQLALTTAATLPAPGARVWGDGQARAEGAGVRFELPGAGSVVWKIRLPRTTALPAPTPTPTPGGDPDEGSSAPGADRGAEHQRLDQLLLERAPGAEAEGQVAQQLG